jgi:RND superfamily putative drug exporter
MSRAFAAIGQLSVRFRWPVLGAWIIATVAAASLLPALSEVAQGNSQDFLPASSPSVRAARLAAPFGATRPVPIPLLASRSGAPLTAADTAALTALQARLRAVRGVTQVRDLGRSGDGRAEELQLLADLNKGPMSGQAADVVNAVRAKIRQAILPAGLQVHLAGDVAAQVDSQSTAGTTASGLLNLAALFVVVLLLFIFRAALAPLVTLAPAFLAVAISGPLVAEATRAGL